MRFAANVSILFTEAPFLERFALAASAGFTAVEFWWPRGQDLEAVESAVAGAGLEVALINFDAGDMPAGDRGLAGDPDRHEEFRANVPVALELARALGCRRLNALLGHRNEALGEAEQLELAAESLRYAADQAKGEKVLVEAVNTFENGPYLVSGTDAAAELVRRVDRPNVGLQYDVYHMQRMEEDVSAALRRHVDGIEHVQIADSPGRHEPGTGAIDFDHVFELLATLSYDGYVGLEYKPLSTTKESLAWLPVERRAAA